MRQDSHLSIWTIVLYTEEEEELSLHEQITQYDSSE